MVLICYGKFLSLYNPKPHTMNEDLNNLHYAPVREYNYAECFDDIQYNGKTLSMSEREAFISGIDSFLAKDLELLSIIKEGVDLSCGDDEYHQLLKTYYSFFMFTTLARIDIMVFSKYFLLANNNYEKRIMRGKLKVILNESFKKIYGFNKSSDKKTEWHKLQRFLRFFPENINHQYQEITSLLDKKSKESTWWKEERDAETHLDVEALYLSREEVIIESKVMIEAASLLGVLKAVGSFLCNVNACVLNDFITRYRRGEIKEG